MTASRLREGPWRSEAVRLWDALLDDVPIPHGTARVVVDGMLIVTRIRRRYLWPADLCHELFVGLPVREVLNVAEWAARSPEEQQIGKLRRWKESKGRQTKEGVA